MHFGAANGAWSEWPLRMGMHLHLTDHGGVATLELCDEQRRLAVWRFTLSLQPQALALLTRFEALQSGVAEAEPTAEEEEIGVQAEAAPSTWVLLRLWRFARPYR